MGNAWSFPTSLNVGGVDYEIRTDYRAVLDLFTALNDPELQDESEELTAYAQTQCILQIMFPQCDDIPDEHIQEALQKVSEFIDMGIRDECKKPKTMDWEQDAPIIIPAVNKVLNTEIRAQKYIHWWTFLGAYMEIGESLYSTVIDIRQKKQKHKKLEKWEEEFYRENKSIVDLKEKYTEEELAEQERFKRLFD
jgi:hypothetical protein